MRLSFESSNADAFVVPLAGAVLLSCFGEGQAGLSESKEHGQRGNGGSPRTWEILSTPFWISGEGRPGDQFSLAGGCCAPCPAERRSGRRTVLPCEGNEVWQEGRQEVVAS